MTLPIVLRRKAGHDLASAYNWYEDQRRNLGEQWLSAVSASFQAIAQFTEVFPRVHREIRRAIRNCGRDNPNTNSEATMTSVSRVAVLLATQLGSALSAFAHPVTDRIGSGGPILTMNDAATA